MLITVTGKAQAVGKSSLIMKIIENIKWDLGVIKTSLQADLKKSLVTDDLEVLSTPGTDTASFLASGARKVVFLRSNYQDLLASLEVAKNLVGHHQYVIIEGNSVLEYLNPDLVIYLDRQTAALKPSALKAQARADLIIDSDQLFSALKNKKPIPFSFQMKKITCVKAQLIAKALGLHYRQLGKILDQQGIKLIHCQLGVF